MTNLGVQHKLKVRGTRRALYLLAVFLLVAISTTADPGLRTVGSDPQDIEKYAVKKVKPSYPPMAEKYKIEGVVTVQLTVDNGGKVAGAEFVRGPNIFRSVSLDAAKRWEFKSSGSDPLQGVIHFTFKLNQ